MMTGSDSNAVAGGLARHIPVLARRAVEWLGVREGGVYVDANVRRRRLLPFDPCRLLVRG